MSNMVGCPADTCEFDGSILAVADHIAESDDEDHTWDALGYENTGGFRHDTHLEEGQRLQEVAKEARDHGKFDVAIEELEGALHHFQRAKLFANDASSIKNRCQEVLRTIDEIETAEQGQVIDDLVDLAESAIDTGDKAHFEGNTDLAGQKYKEAIDTLEEAKTVATELAPNRVSGIDRHLCRVQVRQQSVKLSEVHQPIRELVADARDHAAAGDRAFQKSEYNVYTERRVEINPDRLEEWARANYDDETRVKITTKQGTDVFTHGEYVTTECPVCGEQPTLVKGFGDDREWARMGDDRSCTLEATDR